MSIFTHPCQDPESLPLCKVSISTFHPHWSRQSLARKRPKSDQTKCHAPFSAGKHVGGDMWNMSFHDVMSHHVIMSCHVVTLETDPCVCPCQCSPTHVKDQNPCLCVKCPFQHFSPTHVASRMSKSGSKTPEIRPNKVPRPLFCLQACRG